jgi:hypothetical protein
MQIGAMATASSGTYTIVPDVLGNGEGEEWLGCFWFVVLLEFCSLRCSFFVNESDWEGIRSYIVKTVYQASAVPLLLKLQNDVENNYNCTVLDKRINILGYSEGVYSVVELNC